MFFLGLGNGQAAFISQIVTFDEAEHQFGHGSIIQGDEYEDLPGTLSITIESDGGGHTDAGLLFDTNETNTADPDLEAPFPNGNLSGNTDFKNALVIAENIVDNDNDGFVDSPDDEAAGGIINFNFGCNVGAESFAVDIIDIEGNNRFKLVISSDTMSVELDMNDLIGLNPDINFVDSSANHVSTITKQQLGLDKIRNITFDMEDSGGVDNFTYTVDEDCCNFLIVPEPSNALLLFMGSLLMCFKRSCRKMRSGVPGRNRTCI